MAHPWGIFAMVSLIVVQAFRPVFSGLDEWVGVGKGGKTSPGLRKGIVSTRQWQSARCVIDGKYNIDTYHDAITKSLVLRCGRPKSAQFMTFQRTLKPLEVNMLITVLKKIG